MPNVLDSIIPSFSNWRSNITVRKKIEKVEGLDRPSVRDPLEKLSIEALEKLYDADKLAKDKLEDKAKTNVIGVTITVTLIMGAYSLLQNISIKHGVGIIYTIAFALFVCSVVYMLAAGIHAIHVLTAENTFHTVSLALDGDCLKEEYDKQIGLNRARNTLRNNSVFTSYECIRNALICLFAVMVIAIVPTHNRTHESASALHTDCFLSGEAIQSIADGIDLAVVTAFIESQPLKEGITTAIDENDKLFVKYSIDDGKVIIYLIEPYN
jgi:hypothetical protein